MGKKEQLKSIENRIINYMKLENKGYFSNKKITYSFKESEKEHDLIVKEISNLLNLNRNIKILDVGCGFGALSISLSKKFDKVYGIDINSNFIDVCLELKKLNNLKNYKKRLNDYELYLNYFLKDYIKETLYWQISKIYFRLVYYSFFSFDMKKTIKYFVQMIKSLVNSL
jgi:SAM-dependent methyltransferase